jgi:hypothetical protein
MAAPISTLHFLILERFGTNPQSQAAVMNSTVAFKWVCGQYTNCTMDDPIDPDVAGIGVYSLDLQFGYLIY